MLARGFSDLSETRLPLIFRLAPGPARPFNQLGAGKGHQETRAAWTRQEAWDEADSGSWSAGLGPEASRLAQCAPARKQSKLFNGPTPEN